MKILLDEIVTDIEKTEVVKVTPPTVEVLDTPEKLRAEANRDNPDNPTEKLHSQKYRDTLLDAATQGVAVSQTTPEKIEVNRDGLRDLESTLREKYRTRDLLTFHEYADNFHTWERDGLSPRALFDERRELRLLFDRLAATIHFYVGAAAMLRIRGSRLIGTTALIDEGNGDEQTLLDLTLDELIRQVPEADRLRLSAYRQEETDRADKAETRRREVSASQAGMDRKISTLTQERDAQRQRADKAEKERDELRDAILKAQ